MISHRLLAGICLSLLPLTATAIPSFHQLSFGYALYDDTNEEIESSFVGSQQITLRLAPTSVPEPGTLSLLGVGFAGIWMATRRRARLVFRAAHA